MKHKLLSVLLIVITLAFSFNSQPILAADSGKVLELLLNEGSGAIVHDSSGSNNNANITGAMWIRLPTGKWVLSFNGKDNSISCNYSSSLNVSGATATLTLEAWVNMTQDNSGRWIGTGSDGGTGGYSLYYHQPYGQVCGFIQTATAWNAGVYTQTWLGMNVWHHVVYTYDGYYGRIYIDGHLDGISGPWEDGISPTSTTFQVFQQFAGMIGKIGVYRYDLSQIQIEGIYQAERNNYYQLPTNDPVYVYPAITDTKILPFTIIPQGYVSNSIAISGSPGEYRPASFIIFSPNGISSMTATISDLKGPEGNIGKDAVSIYVVKNWYQAGLNIHDVGNKILTPEMLLKDDSLIKIENGENYIKLADGSYKWISDPTKITQDIIPDPSTFPVKDSSTFQPVEIEAGTNKQFWVTVQIPINAVAGDYDGSISLTTPTGNLSQIQLHLEVFPIQLLEPYLIYGLYYTGVIDSTRPQGTISGSIKSETQLRSELVDLIAHGVTNPTIYQPLDQTLLGKVLTLRNNLGMGGKPLYYLGLWPWGYEPILQVQQIITLAQSYGIPSVYFYGADEVESDALTAQRTSWQAILGAGGKIFAAGCVIPSEHFNLMGDLLDLFIYGGVPNSIEAAKWHSIGHQVFSYNNPQCGEEKPETYRRNYGLLLWQQDFDGTMDFAYQWGTGNIWNDFDNSQFRDHVMAYPTIDGVIGTIQWEGFREGVNDVRYLTTLLETINTAKAAGKNTSAAETWLTNLKGSDLTSLNLDDVRTNMINYILALQTPSVDYITVTPSNPLILAGGTQQFTAQGYDSSNNPISGLTYTWSVNDSAGGSINSSGLFTAGTTAGSYADVIQYVSGGKTGNASVTITASQFAQGDVNLDGSVSILDMILVGQHEAESGIPGWRREDVNLDGVINVLDRIVIGQNWTG